MYQQPVVIYMYFTGYLPSTSTCLVMDTPFPSAPTSRESLGFLGGTRCQLDTYSRGLVMVRSATP